MSAVTAARRRLGPGAWARITIVLAGIGLAVVPAPVHIVPLVLCLLAAAATGLRPARVGALVPTVTFTIGWLAAGGWNDTPDPARTVVAAALLYVLHQATAFATVVPVGAAVERAVLRRWGLRSLPAVALAAVVIVVDLLVSSRPGSVAVEAIALGAVLLVLAVVLRPVLMPESSGDGTA